jgi:hypothetical protein
MNSAAYLTCGRNGDQNSFPITWNQMREFSASGEKLSAGGAPAGAPASGGREAKKASLKIQRNKVLAIASHLRLSYRP